MFAAANTNLIQLFSTFTFENIGNLKGHNGKVARVEGASKQDTRQGYQRKHSLYFHSVILFFLNLLSAHI